MARMAPLRVAGMMADNLLFGLLFGAATGADQRQRAKKVSWFCRNLARPLAGLTRFLNRLRLEWAISSSPVSVAYAFLTQHRGSARTRPRRRRILSQHPPSGK